mgnify:CR=1 FL=1
MFSNIGWGEIFFILIIGLIVIGPERLPSVVEDVRAAIYAARKAMTVAEVERWLAPVLNYIPSQDGAKGQAIAPAATPANDEELASHPQGCTCAVHLAWRKKKVGAG